ncbi:hypothetical protein J437_LFUL016743 [Ladona fulva]|uniref:CLIP domain-containing serine protease n=1 Tax=Ladona fulva TaxID=123851 RepID=A0A8K0KJY7_LADFU|nr:hypothetical protein J437_LFUL016743 [Ladona fulva]
MKGQVYVVACLLLNGYAVGLNLGENCLTPEGESGKCIQLRDCSHYTSILEGLAKPLPTQVVYLLKKAKCGGLGDKPLLCCPGGGSPSKQSEGDLENRCTTPYGGNGKCLAKTECTVFSSQSPVTSQLLQQSRCGRESSGEMYCCPSQAYSANTINHRNVGLLDNHVCGPVSNINILHANGSTSEQYGFPWTALLAYSGEKGAASFRCTGSLISKRYVLTAAHCLKYLRGNVHLVSVRLGELNLETSKDCTEDECVPDPQDVAIERTIVHPQYKGWPNYEHDIALLRLTWDVNLDTRKAFDSYVKPVCIPIGMAHETKDLVGEELLVSGWCSHEGKEIPFLLQKKLKGLSHEECTLMLKKEVPVSSDNQFCTTSEKNSDCEGYGGSPIVKYENGPHGIVAVQYGIASFGPKHCSNSEIPSISTRVSQYSRWILDQMT